MSQGPSEIEFLRLFVEAHNQPDTRTGQREPIWYVQHSGGAHVQHHALAKVPPGVDEALLQELSYKGLITIDYNSQYDWRITPTDLGRRVVKEHDRIESEDLVGDIAPIAEAVASQASATNPLAWPVVRSTLESLRGYWQEGAFRQSGIALKAVWAALPDEHQSLFATTVEALLRDDYLERGGELAFVATDDDGQ